ncbi:hypothetical protein GCM10020367_72120 [Streptomyces sannanensis]|uniref:Secreted protein n=2 Tax=Streptomyces sannanensis TaxID=285536 RepID=A0ABP6SN84_9ACTN
MRRVGRGTAKAGLRGVLALLVVVVGALCLFGRAALHGVPATDVPTVVAQQKPTVDDIDTGAEAPCGKKLVADPSAQRAGSPGPTAASPECAQPAGDLAYPAHQRVGILSGGPAPPSPVILHSVLRM